MTSLILILSFVFALPQVLAAKRMSDREHDGFLGPVKRVFVEWSPVDRPYNNIAPGTRCRQRTDVYDKDGRLTQNSVYPGSCGSDEIREYYAYGPDGSRTQLTDTSRASCIPSAPPPIARRGAQEESGPSRTLFQYDSKGRLAEASTLRPNGRMTYKASFDRDDKNRLLEVRSTDADGRISSRRVYRYEGTSKVPSRFAYYDSAGKVHEEIAYSDYEYNSRGDWVKRKDTRQETIYVDEKPLIRRTISMEHREIEYY